MDLLKLSEPLNASDIDFRVARIAKGGWCTLLAYKNARVDMNRLDEVVDPMNWKRQHLNGNANCIVSIWCAEKKEWVSKEDTGSESLTEREKGLASDSFKRACFNWGIGRELYDYPQIFFQLNPEEFSEYEDRGKKKYKQTFKLKLKDWKWYNEFKDGKLVRLGCRDNNSKVRFDWKRGK